MLNLRKTSIIYYTVYSIFYGWNLNFWYVCAMLVQFSISDSYLNCKGAKQESTHARTNIHYNLLDCSRGQKWRVYSTENMSLCLFKLHTFKSEFHEIYISGKYRVFISTVTNKLSITDTTVHSLAQFGYLSCSIHQDIWYFVSNNPEICFKSLEATSRKNSRFLELAQIGPFLMHGFFKHLICQPKKCIIHETFDQHLLLNHTGVVRQNLAW